MFASHNAFIMKKLARMDDLISLAYLLVYLCNGYASWFGDLGDLTMEKVKEIKIAMTPAKLCVEEAEILRPFVDEAFKCKYAEEPNYPKLKFILCKALLDQDLKPDYKFDWTVRPLLMQNREISDENSSFDCDESEEIDSDPELN